MVAKALRQQVLERDNHECQFDKMFGISNLSGLPCAPDLELHHKTYERSGHEIPDDLITVCTRCHDIITSAVREARYLVRMVDYRIETRKDKPRLNGKEVITDGTYHIYDQGRSPTYSAQWTDGESSGRVCSRNQKGIIEKKKG